MKGGREGGKKAPTLCSIKSLVHIIFSLFSQKKSESVSHSVVSNSL